MYKDDVRETSQTGKGSGSGKGKSKPNSKKGSKHVSRNNTGKRNTKDTSRNNYKSDRIASNDISWYINSPEFAASAANLNSVLSYDGMVDRTYFDGSYTAGDDEYRIPLPGIASVEFAPTIGSNMNDPSAPINTAAMGMTSFIKSKISGTRSWASNDLMMIQLALDSIYMFYMYVTRLYGVSQASWYTATNKFLPRRLLEAMGVPEGVDLTSNSFQLRFIANDLANKLRQFPLVMLPYMERHMFMTGNVFVDDVSPKQQFYVFNPKYYFKYEYSSDGSMLVPSSPNFTANMTSQQFIDELRRFGTDLINTIFTFDEVSQIEGDLLYAYGPSAVVTLSEIPEGYTVLPVGGESAVRMLHQLNNADIVEPNDNEMNFYVKQNVVNSTLYQILEFNSFNAQFDNRVMWYEGPLDVPTAMYNSRFMITSANPTNDESLVQYGYFCGSEVITGIRITQAAQRSARCSALVGTDDTYSYAFPGVLATTSFTQDEWSKFLMASQFNYFPKLYFKVRHTNNNGVMETVPLANWNDYTIVSSRDIRNLHTVAFSGMFKVPYSING